MANETVINLVTGEGCAELREAIQRARRNPGQPVTTGTITVTWNGAGGKQVIEFAAKPDPAEAPAWDWNLR